jgi:hypothetical protein
MTEWLLAGGLGLSLVGNVALALLYRRRLKLRVKKADMTAADLLHDLTRRGQAILRVDVLDQENLMLRSPRG